MQSPCPTAPRSLPSRSTRSTRTRVSSSPATGFTSTTGWRPPWVHDHLDWPDFGVPADPALVATALGSLLDRARAGEQAEVGCLGGHGRTGTALACLAILAGLPAADAVAWVRARYCSKAVETAEQEAFVAGFRR